MLASAASEAGLILVLTPSSSRAALEVGLLGVSPSAPDWSALSILTGEATSVALLLVLARVLFFFLEGSLEGLVADLILSSSLVDSEVLLLLVLPIALSLLVLLGVVLPLVFLVLLEAARSLRVGLGVLLSRARTSLLRVPGLLLLFVEVVIVCVKLSLHDVNTKINSYI